MSLKRIENTGIFVNAVPNDLKKIIFRNDCQGVHSKIQNGPKRNQKSENEIENQR